LPEWANEIKAPCEYFDWGADLRVRDERFPDAIDRDPSAEDPIRQWMRIRTRLWGNIKPVEDVAVRIRLTNESRAIEAPDHFVSSNPHSNYDHLDEFTWDNLYLEMKNFLDSPATIRFFRQDMLAIPGTTGPNGTGFGDGFIFMDGTPGDGSRSFYFDALRATIDLSQWIENSSVDVMGIMNKRLTRHHLHPLGGDDYYSLTDQDGDNEAYGVYFKNASWVPKSQLDAYYFYMWQQDFKPTRWEPMRYRGGYWNNVGARLAGNLAEKTKYVLEACYQFGRGESRVTRLLDDHTGWGTQESISQGFDVWGKPTAKLFHVYLSGDDPDTDEYEAWKALYNRWPKWGELIGYMGPREDGIYYFTNMHMLGLQVDFSPMENVSVMALYQSLWSDENSRPEGTGIFDDGSHRGHNPQLQVGWAPTKWFNTHVRLEYFETGDYFRGEDEGFEEEFYFARWEVYFRF